jgi:competence protein ComEC
MLKFLKFVPVQLTVFLIFGILFGRFFNIEPIQLLIVIGILLVLFVAVFLYANQKFGTSFLFTIVVFVLSFFIGVSAITFKNSQNQQSFYANQPNFSKVTPQTAVIVIRKVLKPTAYSYKYEAIVVDFNAEKTIGKILVNIKKDSVNNLLKVDDELLINTLFHEISAPKNPYGFNYKKYLENQQIYHQIYLENSQFINFKKTNITIKGIAATIRNNIDKALVKNGFKNNELAVIDALLLGQRQNISADLLQNYSGAGAIHILAVSGLHVGIILLILTFLLKPLHYFKNGKQLALFGTVLLLWIFAIIAGLSASVVRAVTMFTAIAIGMYSNRTTNIYNTLIISMFFLLLIHPNYLFEVGFQLSYLAVFAIVWIQPKIVSLWTPKNWLFDKLWQLFTVSIAAQIGVLPLSLFYFHQFPGLFFVSNLVIIPVLGIILFLGIVVIILALLDILPHLLGEFYMLIIETMNNFVGWIANQESFIIQNITFSLVFLLASYAFIFLLFKWTEKRNFNRIVLLFISILIIQGVLIFEKYQMQTTNNFIVFNKSKESMVGIRVEENLEIDTSKNTTDISNYTLKNYLIGTGIKEKINFNEMQKVYFFNNETILMVDSLAVYKLKSFKPTIVILQQSPKINLERLLKILQPKILIADGSNYKSYVLKWKQTCAKNKTPFYNTMQNGAFILDGNGG